MHHLARLSFLLCTATAAAQGFPLLGANQLGQAPFSGPFLNVESTSWNNPPSGSVTRTLPASLTGHNTPDVVTLKGGQMILIAAPGLHQHAGPLPGAGSLAVIDFAVLKGRGDPTGVNLKRDSLALATPTGLMEWFIDDTGNVTINLLNSWSAATRIAAHPRNPAVIFGVSRDGNITVLTDQGGTYDSVTFPGDAVASDIECIDWNGDGVSELAVLSDASLSIYSQGSTTPNVIEAFTAPPTGINDLARIIPFGAGTGPSAETLAWLNSSPVLLLYRDASTPNNVATSTDTVTLPTPNPYAAIAGCKALATDNHDALYLTFANNSTVTVLAQFPNYTFVHDGSSGYQVAVSAAGSSAVAESAVAVADIDVDGDCDLVAVVPDNTGSGVHHVLLQPKFYYRAQQWMPVSVPDPCPQDTIQFSVPGVAGTMTEVTIWATQNGQLVTTPYLSPAPMPYQTTHQLSYAMDTQALLGTYDGFVMMVRPVLMSGGVVLVAGEASFDSVIATYQGPGGGLPGHVIISRSTPVGKLPPPPPGWTPRPKR
ncbi:MAG: hypothetical protein KDC48_13620 [Planctomycetes bacterium]|nr:hypothetical protein [Planctomycetota bacterium]